jgi:hypothetical protein
MKFFRRRPARLPDVESQVDEQELARWREGEASEPTLTPEERAALWERIQAELDCRCPCHAWIAGAPL